MEVLEKGNKSSTNFMNHVFNFDENSKIDMLNIVQYSIISIVPIVILNKSIQKFVPEADETKGSVEIVFEVLIQIVSMFIGLLFVHRIITYIPTYSTSPYPEYNIIYSVLPLLMILMSLQTKLGDKVSILVDRLYELWEGKKDNGGKSPNIKVSQPISQNKTSDDKHLNNQQQHLAQKRVSFSDGTSINDLPTTNVVKQQLPDYDNMYRNDNNPLVDAATPGGESNNIVAANDVLGGSFSSFGSW
jgi:hypothetical protein